MCTGGYPFRVLAARSSYGPDRDCLADIVRSNAFSAPDTRPLVLPRSSIQNAFSFKNQTNFFERCFDVAGWKPNLTQSVNITELLATFL